MHPELERIQNVFNWKIPLTPNESLPNWYPADSRPSVESAYLDDVVTERARIDKKSWWYRTRNQVIIRVFQQTGAPLLWDIGSGTGVVATALMERGWSVIGVEPSLAGSRLTAELGIPTFQSSLEELKLPGESVGALSLLDVLEHVGDRSSLLAEAHRVLTSDGILLITVPALPALWSQFDVHERHFLRYTRASLLRELDAHDFSVTKCGYFFALTVIPLLILRAIPFRLGFKQFLSSSGGVSKRGGFIGVLAEKLEVALALRIPIGSSIIAVAKKRTPAGTV